MKDFISTSLLLFVCNFLLGQSANNYDKICYCSGHQTPHRIVSYDNNFEILISLKKGLSKAELKENNIRFTESQLKLLQVFNLIEKKEGKYFTLITILDSIQTIELRHQSKMISNEILVGIEPKIEDLVNYINTNYNSNSEFSILFSYVFDALIWREFEKLKLIKQKAADKDVLTWDGHFWMVPFPRDSRCGTNSSTEKNTTIFITNGVPWKYLKPLYDNRGYMSKMISDINDYGGIKDLEVIDKFSEYNIFDNKGNVLVPVIYENNSDKIFKLVTSLSKELAAQFLEKITISEIEKKYSFANSESALVIFYHEVMWGLVELMEEKNIVKKPQILTDDSERDLNEMADLIFLVVRK